MDYAAVHGLASSIDAQAAAIPTGTALSIDGCGSSVVAEAAASFSLWAHVQNQQIAEKLSREATSARDASNAFQATDTALGAGATGE